jgi:hypothetical protein
MQYTESKLWLQAAATEYAFQIYAEYTFCSKKDLFRNILFISEKDTELEVFARSVLLPSMKRPTQNVQVTLSAYI